MPPDSFAFRLGEWSDIKLSTQIRMSGEGETLIAYNMREEGRYNLIVGTSYMVLEKETSGTVSRTWKSECWFVSQHLGNALHLGFRLSTPDINQ